MTSWMTWSDMPIVERAEVQAYFILQQLGVSLQILAQEAHLTRQLNMGINFFT
jgi:hypothetical protein